MTTGVTLFHEQVRSLLTQKIAELGRAPSNDQLASSLHFSIEQIEEALLSLHSTHSLLLHPHKVEPWVVHPFSLYPASCWVQTSGRGYWATCLYCAFGIAAALKSDADIFTRFGGESEQCIVRVRDQNVLEEDLVFHLSTPIGQWWDNVIHACASFQPFHTDREVDDWCQRHNMPKGAVVPLPQMWKFASSWYGDYVAQPWQKRSVEEVRRLLRSHDLVGEFWSVKQ